MQKVWEEGRRGLPGAFHQIPGGNAGMMDEANRVPAYLKVTAEFYDPEATPETVRYSVEQALEDAGYEVEVSSFGNWISVKDRLPESAGAATLVTAVNTHGQKFVFEAFLGYGDMHWYTLDTTKMQKHGSNRVDSCWTITHWMEMPEPAEE
jgi:hypothetical protein